MNVKEQARRQLADCSIVTPARLTQATVEQAMREAFVQGAVWQSERPTEPDATSEIDGRRIEAAARAIHARQTELNGWVRRDWDDLSALSRSLWTETAVAAIHAYRRGCRSDEGTHRMVTDTQGDA